tara:strand:- start:150 stop:629 length:480 start_codon:yes stop_codon:yes gene_type:complete
VGLTTGGNMSTNSFIAIQKKNASIISTYVHWDGSPEGVGHTLLKYYSDKRSATEVCKLGYISSLYPSIQQTKEESAHNEEPIKHEDFEAFEDKLWSGIEYIYLYVPSENGYGGLQGDLDSDQVGYWLFKKVASSKLNGRSGIDSLYPLEMEIANYKEGI